MRLIIDLNDPPEQVANAHDVAVNALLAAGCNPFRTRVEDDTETKLLERQAGSYGHVVLVFKAGYVDDEVVQGETRTPDGRSGGLLTFGRSEWDGVFGEIAVGAEETMVLERTVALGGTAISEEAWASVRDEQTPTVFEIYRCPNCNAITELSGDDEYPLTNRHIDHGSNPGSMCPDCSTQFTPSGVLVVMVVGGTWSGTAPDFTVGGER